MSKKTCGSCANWTRFGLEVGVCPFNQTMIGVTRYAQVLDEDEGCRCKEHYEERDRSGGRALERVLDDIDERKALEQRYEQLEQVTREMFDVIRNDEPYPIVYVYKQALERLGVMTDE